MLSADAFVNVSTCSFTILQEWCLRRDPPHDCKVLWVYSNTHKSAIIHSFNHSFTFQENICEANQSVKKWLHLVLRCPCYSVIIVLSIWLGLGLRFGLGLLAYNYASFIVIIHYYTLLLLNNSKSM